MQIEIDGVGYAVAFEVAELLKNVSEERDALQRDAEICWKRLLARRTLADLSIAGGIDRIANERDAAMNEPKLRYFITFHGPHIRQTLQRQISPDRWQNLGNEEIPVVLDQTQT